jgi:putative peptide zinc metalloprotease protein
MRRLTLLLIATVLAIGLAWPGVAGAQDSTAIAINTKDGTSIFKIAFQIARVNQDVVDNGNAAVAVNSCTECQSIATAFQIVLVFSDPDVVTPTNLALSLNTECEACVAFASAFQWVLGTGGPVHFTAEGNLRLAELRQRLHDLSKENLTIEQLQAELDQIAAEIADILANELVPAGPSDAQDSSASASSTPATTTEPDATTTAPADTTTSEPTTTEESTTTTAP